MKYYVVLLSESETKQGDHTVVEPNMSATFYKLLAVKSVDMSLWKKLISLPDQFPKADHILILFYFQVSSLTHWFWSNILCGMHDCFDVADNLKEHDAWAE